MRNLLIIFCLIPALLFSQKKGTTFGFQIKPIIPVNYFNAGPQLLSDSLIEVSLTPKLGFSFGAIVRQRLSKSISIESGISSVRRNYDVTANSLINSTSDQSDFGFVGYQIPLQALFYIQLSEKIFMNTTAGFGLDMYPSSIETIGENARLINLTLRQFWINYSLLANIGFEYRTEEKGTFYIGGSFNRPFNEIAQSNFSYNYEGTKKTNLSTFLNGNYITLDLRFFFPENEEEVKKKR